MRVGAIGLGEMGSRFTQSLTANGFWVTRVDPREARLSTLRDMIGAPAGNVTEGAGRVPMRST